MIAESRQLSEQGRNPEANALLRQAEAEIRGGLKQGGQVGLGIILIPIIGTLATVAGYIIFFS